jgi:hypothetical protein
MTCSTIGAELPIMGIILRMAGIAILGRALKLAIRMTGRAIHPSMLSGQWK